MNIVRSFTAFLLLLGFSLSVFAYSTSNAGILFNKGLTAYNKHDFKKAEQYWRVAAERDHVPSMYSLATLYEHGALGTPDLKKAEHWYLKAARRGAIPAQYNLGKLLYDRGAYKEAAKWLTEAAKADFASAQNDLAAMYEQGKGVNKSLSEAAKWYLKAAGNGFAPAQFKLVMMYMNGKGVEKDNEKAFIWAKKASESGDPNAKYLLGYMYYTGTGTVQSLEMASIWLEEAIDDGQPKAKKLLKEVERAQKQRVSSR